MAEFSPSPQQQSAIQTDEKALLISAAAGSGKTTVLVRRVLRLLCDGNPKHTADRLMVVTFTVAAAAKLKNDLNRRLSEMISQRQSDTRLLKKQRMLLPRAAIGTFDSFCKNLCIEFFTNLNIEPDFKVGERHILDMLEQQAMSATLEHMLTDDDFRAFASNSLNPRSLAEAQDAILMLHRRMVSRPFPRDFIIQQAEATQPKELRLTPAGTVLFDHAVETLNSAALYLQRAISLAVSGGMAQKPLAVLQQEQSYVAALINAAQRGDYTGLRDIFSVGPSNGGYQTFRQNKEIDPETKDLIKLLRGCAKDLCCGLYEDCFLADEGKIAELSAQNHRLSTALCNAVLYYHDTLTMAKRQAACFDFYDLQHMAVQLLSMPQLPICGRYFAVMVDEYQDTNPIADYIYHAVAGPNTGALFLVGDVKQSIYGFNSARPDIFAGRVERSRRSSKSQVIYLSQNYRSSAGVINTVNDLFTLTMTRCLGGVDYDDDNRLYIGRSDAENGLAELHICDGSDTMPVALHCCELIKQGHKAQDICILVQTNKEVGEYAVALEQIGLMAELAGNKPLSEEIGAMPLIALLRFVANPFDEVDLVAVLLSPLAGFTTDDVAKLYIGDHPRLITAMSASDNERMRSFASILWDLHRESGSVSVRVLLQRIYERLNAYVLCCAMSATAPMAIAEIENLAIQYDSLGMGGITGFVRRLNIALQSNSRKKSEPLPRLGFVNIMTIHNSKGLEFPICILAGTSKPFNKRDLYSAVLHNDKTSIGMKIVTEQGFVQTPHRIATAIASSDELQGESLRLLYVATTRAMNRLYMFVESTDKRLAELAATLYGEGGITPALLKRQRSFGDILLLFGLCHRQGELLRELSGNIPVPTIDGKGSLAIKLSILPQQLPKPQEEEVSQQDTAPLLSMFGWRYHDLDKTVTPVKHSVTELLNSSQQLKPEPAVPSFSAEQAGGAKRGSATHAFLQLCKMPLSAQELQGELNRLVEQKFIPADQAQLVNLKRVKEFLLSDLAKRMEKADKLYREYEFITEHDGSIVQGIVDLFFIEQGGIVVVDYKTTRADADQLKQLYADQLNIYATAVEKRLNLPVRQKIIYSLSMGREINI